MVIRARWFNGQSSRASEVVVTFAPGPKGPSLQLHPPDQPGTAARTFAHAQVEWPHVWSRRRAPAVLTVALDGAGSL
jgi:hypothetical protein